MAILSFSDRHTLELYSTGTSREFANIASVAQRKLAMLDAAVSLNDLRSPPANRLEKLVGDRDGQYSIRINDQFRLVFTWTDNGASDVEIVDYH